MSASDGAFDTAYRIVQESHQTSPHRQNASMWHRSQQTSFPSYFYWGPKPLGESSSTGGELTSRFTVLVVAVEEVRSCEATADIEHEEAQFPSERCHFLSEREYFT